MKVLISEDNKNTRYDIKRIIELVFNEKKEIYHITEAKNYSEALKAVEEREYDLILTDLHLSGSGDAKSHEEGYNIAKAALTRNANTCIFILSAYLSDEDIFRDDAKNYNLILKGTPLWPSILTRELEKFLDKRSFYIEKLWNQSPKSYWITQLYSLADPISREIFTNISLFATTTSRNEARLHVSCDGFEFRKEISNHFSSNAVPVIFLSADPSFNKYILCDTEIIYKLRQEEFGIRNFCVEAHERIVNHNDLEKLLREMNSEVFWKRFVKDVPVYLDLAQKGIKFISSIIGTITPLIP